MSLNLAQIIGHLGQDPEQKFLPSGTAVVNLRIATTERFKNKDGEKQEKTEWHSVALFGRLAEIAAQYLKKGSLVYIAGRIETRKYKAKDGSDRYATGIVGSEMRMLGGKPEGGSKPARQAKAPDDGGPADLDDDIPF